MKTKKNNITTLLFLTIMSFGVFSCQTDLLNPVPKTVFSDKVVFDTPARVDLQVNALYSFLKSGNLLGGRAQIYGDIRANDFLNRLTNSVTGFQVWNHNLPETSANDVLNMWNAGYAAINQCNVFIKGMTDNAAKFVQPTFPAGYAATANQRIAEARTVRAIAYYTLLQLYARPYADGNGNKPGLPLRLNAETGSNNNNLARATVADVYAQILADLNFGEANLPLTYTTQALNTTRAHVNTAIAFKTRVYLTMGQYANVVAEGNKIVPLVAPFTVTAPGVKFALQASYTAQFQPPQETLETILGMPFTAQDTPGGQNQLNFYYGPPITGGGNGEYSLNPAGIIGNTTFWKAADTRRTFVVANTTEFFLRKYPTAAPFTDKAPIMRYSEVLLNVAEALWRANPADARALALFNSVHGRSDAATVFVTLTLDDFLNERNVEFLGEGLRSTDLLRNLLPIPGKTGAPGVIAQTSVNYIWPIPSSELSTNSLMVRN